MDSSAIQKPERKKILDTIIEVGLNPTEFEERRSSPQSLKIVYKNSGLYFQFEMRPSSYNEFLYYYTCYTPDRKRVENNRKYLLIDHLLFEFKNWLIGHVKQYKSVQEMPDPWLVFTENSELSFSNTVFNQEKIKLIEPKLDEVKFRIENLNLEKSLQDQLNKFAAELSEIKTELKTLKKKSWIRQFIGWGFQLTNFATSHAPDKVEEIKQIINDFFDQFNQQLIA